jgi:hypothetical protein
MQVGVSGQLRSVGFRSIVQFRPGIAGNIVSSEPRQGPKTLNINLQATGLQKKLMHRLANIAKDRILQPVLECSFHEYTFHHRCYPCRGQGHTHEIEQGQGPA